VPVLHAQGVPGSVLAEASEEAEQGTGVPESNGEPGGAGGVPGAGAAVEAEAQAVAEGVPGGVPVKVSVGGGRERWPFLQQKT